MNMKKNITFWDQVMSAITFAEENAHHLARHMMENKTYAKISSNTDSVKRIHGKSQPGN